MSLLTIQRHHLPFSFGEVPAVLISNHASDLVSRDTDPRGARPFLSHSHSYVEIQYILDGQGILSTSPGSYELKPGRLILLPPHLDHRLQLTSPMLSRLAISLLFLSAPTPATPADFLPFFSACRAKTPVLLDVPPSDMLAHTLDDMRALVSPQPLDAHARELLRAQCIRFLVAFSRALPNTIAHTEPLCPAPSVTREQEIMDYFFSSSFSTKCGLAALAQQLHISTRQLNRIIRNTYGMTFRQKINARRLSIALDRLRNSDDSLQEIAQLLGFGSTTAFGIFIKKATGLPPSHIRRGAPVGPD